MRLGRVLDALMTSLLLTMLLLTLTGSLTFAVVEGRSMEPLLWTGDVVMIYKSDDIRVGDVVIYAGFRGYIIHRVIEARDNCYVIKGDSNPAPDGCIPKELILGKAVSLRGSVVKIPGIGYLTLLLRS